MSRWKSSMHPLRAHIYEAQKLSEKAADVLCERFFTWTCFWAHVVWFALWLGLHLDINLLTMVVSLEAIFLCILLGMSQNRQAQRDRKRDDTEAEEVKALWSLNKRQMDLLQQNTELTELIHDHIKKST